jgi:hypothetical protein
MLPGESGFPILAFAVARVGDSVFVGDQVNEIGAAASTVAVRAVARRVVLFSIVFFHIFTLLNCPPSFVKL